MAKPVETIQLNCKIVREKASLERWWVAKHLCFKCHDHLELLVASHFNASPHFYSDLPALSLLQCQGEVKHKLEEHHFIQCTIRWHKHLIPKFQITCSSSSSSCLSSLSYIHFYPTAPHPSHPISSPTTPSAHNPHNPPLVFFPLHCSPLPNHFLYLVPKFAFPSHQLPSSAAIIYPNHLPVTVTIFPSQRFYPSIYLFSLGIP